VLCEDVVAVEEEVGPEDVDAVELVVVVAALDVEPVVVAAEFLAAGVFEAGVLAAVATAGV
jgi:hypothetical protein